MKSAPTKTPVKKAKTLVTNKAQYAPNFDAKSQTSMEAATKKVGKKVARKS